MSARLRPIATTLMLLPLLALGCSDDGATADDTGDESSSSDETSSTSDETSSTSESDTSDVATVSVSGDAFAFGPGTMLADATVTILELPDQQAITDDAGHFVFPELPAGALASFRFEKPGNPVVHTKTFTLPAEDGAVIERVSFQVPDDSTFAALAAVVQITPDPERCQIASTVTRVGKSIYDAGAHGESGATVTIEPALLPEQGPVYFNDNVIPQLDLTETSTDGGVLYTNVPPGVYTLTAHKPGVSFESVTVRCEPSVLVNPSPPYGLQALE